MRREFNDIALSSVYESDAEGFAGDAFYNLVVSFDAEDVNSVMQTLRRIEDEHGRIRQKAKFSSRSLDLDLLLFGEQIIPALGIPRDEITRYAFVLWPLAEIAPQARHPVTGDAFEDLWREYQREHAHMLHSIEPIAFTWDPP
jgi:2-amino-4-hydroxy-6-hydroxymethyldihydropteridine diphosphokinase